MTVYMFVQSWFHLELGHELCENAEERLRSGGLAVLAKVRGHLGELLHRSALQGLQRLDCRVAVLQEALWVEVHTPKFRLLIMNIHCCY